MVVIITFQDFEIAREKGEIEKFIGETIDNYKGSESFNTAREAQAYYKGENTAIVARMTYLQRIGRMDSRVRFHKLRNGFFPKAVKQLGQYLLGNGVTLESDVKNKLGIGFDKTLQAMGMQALVDGVCWGFWEIDHMVLFRATEFIPLLDEETADIKAAIRFFRIDEDKPLFVELFQESGITKYKGKDERSLVKSADETPYKYHQRTYETDRTESVVVDTDNYPIIPVFPLYANELHRSEFTPGIRSMIDAYDFISSDLADGITLIEGLYWIFKNFGGDDVKELAKEIQAIKVAHTVNDETDVTHNVVEIPFQAKQTALDLLEKQMYNDFMAMNMKEITGGSLTNIAINVAKTDLDLKADIFEWQCASLVQNILLLLGIDGVEPKFKRRSISNDSEMVTNIYTMRGDLDRRTALILNPLIPDDMVDSILKNLDAEDATGVSSLEELEKAIEAEKDPEEVISDGQGS